MAVDDASKKRKTEDMLTMTDAEYEFYKSYKFRRLDSWDPNVNYLENSPSNRDSWTWESWWDYETSSWKSWW